MSAAGDFLVLGATAFASVSGLAAQNAADPGLTSAEVRIEVTVPGSPDATYDAITGDVSGWWDHSFTRNPARFFLEPRPGGRFLEIFDDSGDGAVHGTVIYAKRGERLRFDGPLGFSGQAVQIVTTYDFTAAGTDSTLLVVQVNAAGTLDARERNALESVWRHFIVDRFKPYVEERHAAAGEPARPLASTSEGEAEGMERQGTQDGSDRQDLEAIARLHARDMAAARAGDAKALAALWTEDVVALGPDEPIRRGKADMLEGLRRSLASSAEWETLEYVLHIEEVSVLGDHAFDWGTFEGTVRHRESGETARSSGKLLRVLRRAPSGEWHVHRTIWNVDP